MLGRPTKVGFSLLSGASILGGVAQKSAQGRGLSRSTKLTMPPFQRALDRSKGGLWDQMMD